MARAQHASGAYFDALKLDALWIRLCQPFTHCGSRRCRENQQQEPRDDYQFRHEIPPGTVPAAALQNCCLPSRPARTRVLTLCPRLVERPAPIGTHTIRDRSHRAASMSVPPRRGPVVGWLVPGTSLFSGRALRPPSNPPHRASSLGLRPPREGSRNPPSQRGAPLGGGPFHARSAPPAVPSGLLRLPPHHARNNPLHTLLTRVLPSSTVATGPKNAFAGFRVPLVEKRQSHGRPCQAARVATEVKSVSPCHRRPALSKTAGISLARGPGVRTITDPRRKGGPPMLEFTLLVLFVLFLFGGEDVGWSGPRTRRPK